MSTSQSINGGQPVSLNSSSPSPKRPSLPISDPPPQPIPPAPEPPPINLASPSPPNPKPPSADPDPNRQWTSLFANKPRNAGVFSHPPLQLKYSGKNLQPTEEIYDAGKEVWSEYLVGFFLDSPLSFTAVTTRLQKLWKPSGRIKIKSTGTIFFFLFSDPEDKRRILCSDPIVIRGKVFIIKPWDCNISSSCVKSVPIWIKLTNIPLYAWTKIGICWLSTHIGRFLCLDAATETLDRLSYAKILVEITPSSVLPNEFPALLPDGSVQNVCVEYPWKPDICSVCSSFGHLPAMCKNTPSIVVESRKEHVNGNSAGKDKQQVEKQPTGFVNNNVIRKQTWSVVDNKKKKHDAVIQGGGNKTDGSAVDLRNINSFDALSQDIENTVNGTNEQDYEEGEIRRVDEMLTRVFAPFSEAAAAVLGTNTETEGGDECTNEMAGNRGMAGEVNVDIITKESDNVDTMADVFARPQESGNVDKASSIADVLTANEACVAIIKEKEPQATTSSLASEDVAIKASSPLTSIKPGFLNKSPCRPKQDNKFGSTGAKEKSTAELKSGDEKEKSTLKTHPYAHIQAPPGYKAPPPMPAKELSTHSPISASHPGYITRSKKSVMGVGSIFDND